MKNLFLVQERHSPLYGNAYNGRLEYFLADDTKTIKDYLISMYGALEYTTSDKNNTTTTTLDIVVRNVKEL